MNERKVPLVGVLAAAIFAGQMLTFTIAGGTSGHLMGAAIATILLGPWTAILVMTSVVSIQALIFQDGGLLAMGANIFNMAVVGVAVSYMAYRTIQKLTGGPRWKIYAGGFIAAWLSIEIVALSVAFQLALSGTSPANIAIPTMGSIHAIIGVGEGLITIGALGLIFAARPDFLETGKEQPSGGVIIWVIGLLLAIGLAIASPLASSHPDGLQWMAERQGFLATAKAPLYNLIPDYILPGVSNEALATVLAGVVGTLIVFGVAIAIAYTRRSRQSAKTLSE
jgi:cobalt/nickel transport system permease protein